MKIKDLPIISGIDKIRIYFNNEIQTEFWYDSFKGIPFSEIHPKWKLKEINHLNILLTGISVDIMILEIYLK